MMHDAHRAGGRAFAGEDAAEDVTTFEIESIARTRVERARIDILLEHPYFATALLAIPLRGTAERAISKALVTDGQRIVYRHDLVAALDRPSIRRLIMHALAHTLLRHPERGGTRDWDRWTVACDIAVELLLRDFGMDREQGSEQSASPARSEPVLKEFEGRAAEEIYEVLASQPTRALGPLSDPADAMLRPSAAADARAKVDDEDDDGSRRSAEERHASERASFERAASEDEAPTAVELERLTRGFATSVKSTKPGGSAGDGSSEIDAAQTSKVPWLQLLAQFMRERIGRSWSFARPNRKHLWRGLYLPGPSELEAGRFVVAIDTSGSMSDRDLGMILSEIDAISRMCACELTVLQFDSEIHAVAEFSHHGQEDASIGSTRIMRMFGRGGTDLRRPFEWVDEQRRNGRSISALIVCTDGFGPLPAAAPPSLPVLFMLTLNHAAPKFGEHIVLGWSSFGTTARVGGGDPALAPSLAHSLARMSAEEDMASALGF